MFQRGAKQELACAPALLRSPVSAHEILLCGLYGYSTQPGGDNSDLTQSFYIAVILMPYSCIAEASDLMQLINCGVINGRWDTEILQKQC